MFVQLVGFERAPYGEELEPPFLATSFATAAASQTFPVTCAGHQGAITLGAYAGLSVAPEVVVGAYISAYVVEPDGMFLHMP